MLSPIRKDQNFICFHSYICKINEKQIDNKIKLLHTTYTPYPQLMKEDAWLKHANYYRMSTKNKPIFYNNSLQ